jgi:hypothetical protein
MSHSAILPRALIAYATVMATILVGATAVACGSDDSPVVPKTPTWTATLNGANEVPAKAVAGTATGTVVKNGSTYTYTINYTGLTSAPNNAHIHAPAAAGVNATVLVPFSIAGATGASGTITGTFTAANIANAAISADSLEVLMSNGNAYLNVHTPANGGGEIRGQLTKQQ